MASPRQLAKLLLLSENPAYLRSRAFKVKRRYGVHPINRNRRLHGEYHHLFRDLRNDEVRFFEYTRMSLKTFEYILQKVAPRLTKRRMGLQQQVTPEEKLVVTLRFLATGASFRHIAFEFRLGRRTVSMIVYDTCTAIVREFGPDVMPPPTEDHLKYVAERYYLLWKFPNCIGAIDGRHCELKCPPHSGSSYFNYLKYFSVVLMGVADADKKFLIIDVGARGKQSDGGIFTATELFRRLENSAFNVPPDKTLPNSNISAPHVLIGDEAFPLKPYLMRPFPAKHISSDKENFNANLARARKTIECAFGILRAKWRFLGTALEIPTVSKINNLVQTACILHNIIRDKDGINDPDYISVLREENHNESGTSVGHVPKQYRRPTAPAIEIRNKCMTYFKHT